MKTSASVSSHALGAEGATVLGKLVANAMAILKDPCKECKKSVAAGDEFEFALVALMQDDNTPSEDMVYVVAFEDLKLKKNITLGLGKTNGRDRVSNW